MAVTYRVDQSSKSQYQLYPLTVVHPSGGAAYFQTGTLIGTYATGAEALDKAKSFDPSLVILTDDTLANPADTSTPDKLLYLSLRPHAYIGLAAANPSVPFDWQCLSPCPKGITFPEVEHSEFIRFLRGEFGGVALTYTVTPAVSGGGGDYTETGDSVVKTTKARPSKIKCGQRVCTKPGTYVSPASVDNPLNYFIYLIGSSEIISASTYTETGGAPPSGSIQEIDGFPDFALGFFRASDNTRKISLWFLGAGSSSNMNTALWVYAPVVGADFHDVYNIPQLPDGDTFSEITASLAFLGVTLSVWGYKQTLSGGGDTFDSFSSFSLGET